MKLNKYRIYFFKIKDQKYFKFKAGNKLYKLQYGLAITKNGKDYIIYFFCLNIFKYFKYFKQDVEHNYLIIDNKKYQDKVKYICELWEDGRVVDASSLLNCQTPNRGLEGSNPSPSAI